MTTLIGTFSKATTLVDGGWRISFDVDENQAAEIVAASKLKGKVVFISIITKAEQKRVEQREKSDG
jgi:hypothetical protein